VNGSARATGVNRLARLFALSCALVAPVAAAQPSVAFDGERYVMRGDARGAPVPLVEYVRPGESLQDWTRLVALRHFAKLDDPRAAAGNLARIVRQHNSNARADVIAKNDGSEAIVDFITWAPGDDRLEFNVHRYRRVEGLPGLWPTSSPGASARPSCRTRPRRSAPIASAGSTR